MAKPVRFAVGNPTDIRSSVWRLWGQGDELYLAAQNVAGQLKISFHKSGIVRIAQPSSEPRAALGRFEFDRDSLDTAWRIFLIIVPPIVSKYPIRDTTRFDKKIIWVPTPKPELKTIFSILMGGPQITAADILRLPKDREMKLLGSFRLKTRTVWLITYFDEFRPETEMPNIADALDRVQIPIKPGNVVNAYVQIFSEEKAIVADVQLGKEHFVSDPNAAPVDRVKVIKSSPQKKRS